MEQANRLNEVLATHRQRDYPLLLVTYMYVYNTTDDLVKLRNTKVYIANLLNWIPRLVNF